MIDALGHNHIPAGVREGGQFTHGAQVASVAFTAAEKAALKAYANDAEAVNDALRRADLTTIGGVAAAARVNQTQLAAVAAAIGAENGAEFVNPGVKSIEGIARKVNAGRLPGNVNDAVRGGYDVATPAQADALVEGLGRHFKIEDEGWSKTPAGYFDRKVIINFPNGQRGEVQMWPPGMLDAKSNGGHKLYEEWRVLPKDNPKAGQINEQMKALYAGVEAKMPPEWAGLFR